MYRAEQGALRHPSMKCQLKEALRRLHRASLFVSFISRFVCWSLVGFIFRFPKGRVNVWVQHRGKVWGFVTNMRGKCYLLPSIALFMKKRLDIFTNAYLISTKIIKIQVWILSFTFNCLKRRSGAECHKIFPPVKSAKTVRKNTWFKASWLCLSRSFHLIT